MKSWLGRVILGLCCIALMAGFTACIADEVSQPVPGDPDGIPVGCAVVDPQPATLGESILVFVTGIYLALL